MTPTSWGLHKSLTRLHSKARILISPHSILVVNFRLSLDSLEVAKAPAHLSFLESQIKLTICPALYTLDHAPLYHAAQLGTVSPSLLFSLYFALEQDVPSEFLNFLHNGTWCYPLVTVSLVSVVYQFCNLASSRAIAVIV